MDELAVIYLLLLAAGVGAWASVLEALMHGLFVMFLCRLGLPSACVVWHIGDQRGSSLDGKIIGWIPDVCHQVPPRGVG